VAISLGIGSQGPDECETRVFEVCFRCATQGETSKQGAAEGGEATSGINLKTPLFAACETLKHTLGRSPDQQAMACALLGNSVQAAILTDHLLTSWLFSRPD
jgi:hypothetical protein